MKNVTKIYELRTLGYADIRKEQSEIAKGFDAIRKAKQAAEKGFYTSTDVEEVKKYAEEIARLRQKEQELRVNRQQMMNEQKAINLERQKQLQATRDQTKANQTELNSYNALYQQYKQLYSLVKNMSSTGSISFMGNTLNYDQAIAKLKELATAEQDFRRQFSKDGLLVAEYTSGIVQAFRKNGLDDLIKGQITKARERISGLNQDFKAMQAELSAIRVSGTGSFENLEKKILENRKEAEKLTSEVVELQTEFRNAGNVGNQITSSISKGFKVLKGQVGSFMLQYIGLTALFNGISSVVSQSRSQAVALDSYESSLRAVSKTTEEYAVNQAFLNRIVDQYGTVLIDTGNTFKNFYASSTLAGISAEETRQIYESVIDAAATLRLSQDNINGTLIAFGQIASKGKVQAEELRGQIGERLPGAFSIAAKAMGVTQQELNKMLESGEVISSEFLPKFAKELQSTFTTGGRQVESLTAIINRGQNRITEFINQNQELVKSAIVNLTRLTGVILILASLILSLPFPVLLTGLVTAALFTDNLVAAKARLLLAYTLEKAALVIEIAQMALRNTVIATATLLTFAYNTVLLKTTTSTVAVTAATRLWAAAIAFLASPVGIALGLLVGLVTIVGVFNSRANDATKAILSLSGSKKIDNEITSAATKLAGEQINRLEALGRVVLNNKNNIDVRRAAVNEAIKMNYAFSDSIQDNIINEQKFMATLRQVRNELLITAKAKASQDATERELKNVETIRSLRAKIAIESENQRGKAQIFLKDISKEQQEQILGLGSFLGTPLSNQLTGSTTLRGNKAGIATFSAFDLANIDKLLEQEESKRQDVFNKYYTKNLEFQKGAEALTKKQVEEQRKKSDKEKLTSPELQALIDGVEADIKTLKEGDPQLKVLHDRKKSYQDRLDAINFVEKKGTQKTYRGARLTGQQRDNVKDIESERDEELALNESSFIAKNKTEEQYLLKSLEINKKALNEKINLLKGSNAEERKQIAQSKLEIQKLEKDTADKIFEINSKRLTDQFEDDKKAEQEKADRVKNDPSLNVTQTARAQAQLDADRNILALQEKFNKDMDALEKNRNNLTVKNAGDRKKALSDINQAITKDEAEIIKSNIEDTRRAGENVLAEFNLVMDRAAALIQADNRLSSSQKARKLQQLEREREYGILVRQAANYQVLEQEFKRAYDSGLITLQEYEEIVARLQELQQKIASDPKNTKLTFRDAFRGDVGQDLMKTVSGAASRYGSSFQDKVVLGVKVDKEQAEQYAKAFAQVISDSYSTAQQAMQGYFNAEANAIQQSLELQIERMEIEEEQVKARAQSTAEIESIERQYAAKKRTAEQQAFEKTRDLKKKEAIINLNTELGGIWASVWSIGNPIAAAILGAVMSGLAVVRYGMRISEINSQKYEFGGSPDEVPANGGEFGGRPHSQGGTDFHYKGRRYNAEVKELAIVRTKNADQSKKYTISGSFKEIASKLNELGGGKAFRPGAVLQRFAEGGYLGQSLQAPVMPGQVNNFITNNPAFEQFKEVIETIDTKTDAINDRIDRLQVVQKTSTVTDAQAKEVKQKSIGEL